MTANQAVGTARGGASDPPAPDAPAGGRQQGFTMIELVVAMTVFALLLGAVAYSSGELMGLTRSNMNRSVAANLASQEIDRVRAVLATDTSSAQTTVTTPAVVGGVTYHVVTSVRYESVEAGANICSSPGSSAAQVLVVNVAVQWAPFDATHAAYATTEVSPPAGVSQAASKGVIPVTVDDQSGGGLANVGVTVSGGGSNQAVLPTDANGCAYFVMASGSYTVTLGPPGGTYVDRYGNVNPQKGFALAVGGNMPQQFDYAKAASLAVSFPDDDSAAIPSSLPLSVGYSYYPAPGYHTYPPGTTSIGNLFPDGYQVWAGDCADADPAWWGAQRPTAADASVTASPAPVDLPRVAITATDSAGNPVAGATVVAVHDDATSPCPSQAGGSAPETIPLGTTDATGALLAGMPYGNWLIQVSSGTSAQSTLALSPAGASPAPVAVSLP